MIPRNLFPEYKKNPTAAIVGFASNTRHLAPYNDPAVDLYCLNEAYGYSWMKQIRPAGWFQMHPKWDFMRANNRNDPAHWSWLQRVHDFPIFMQAEFPDVPSSVRYPIDTAIDAFGMYFTSSFSYMLALMILMGYERIEIYGFEMSSDSEYCVGPDTPVLTADLRWVPAKDLQVGQEIIAFDEYPTDGNTRRRWRKATVEATKIIQRPSYRLTMEDGTKLIASKEHRWFTGNSNGHDWVTTENITPHTGRKGRGGTATRLLRATPVWEAADSFDAGYVSGVFDGEGSLTQSQRKECNGHLNKLQFAQRENAVLNHTLQVLTDYGFQLHDYSNKNQTCRTYDIRGGVTEIMRCLGTFRPKRLLPKFDPDTLGMFQAHATVRVMQMEDIGEQDVVAMKTSTGTFIADGYASHNSYQKPAAEYLMGFAKGLGIEIVLPAECSLLRGNLYAYEDLRAADRTFFSMREHLLKKELEDRTEKSHRIAGKVDELEDILRMPEVRELPHLQSIMAGRYVTRKTEQIEYAIAAAVAEGAMIEMQNMIRWHDSQNIPADREAATNE